jgi:hypothetical protein
VLTELEIKFLIQAARSWPADLIDRDIIDDLAAALEEVSGVAGFRPDPEPVTWDSRIPKRPLRRSTSPRSDHG